MRNLFFLFFLNTIVTYSQAPEVVVQVAHNRMINCIAKHPTKNIIATGSADNSIKIWDYNSRKLISTLNKHEDMVNSMAFMPGNTQYLLSGAVEDKTLVLWDISTAKRVMEYTDNTNYWLEGIGFTAASAEGKAGRFFWAGYQFCIEKWETLSGRLIERWTLDSLVNDGKHHWMRHFQYDPIRDLSYFSEGGTIYSLNHKTKKVKILLNSNIPVSGLDYNLKKNILAVANTKGFVIYDLKEFKEIYSDTGKSNGGTHSISLSESGARALLNEGDYSSRIIDLTSKRNLLLMNGRMIQNAVFIENDEYVILTGGKTMPEIFNISTAQPRPFNVINNAVEALSLSNDNRYLLKAGSESTVKIFDLHNGDITGVLNGHKGKVYSAIYSPDNKLIATGSDDKTIKLWDAKTFQSIQTLNFPEDVKKLGYERHPNLAFKEISFSDDGKFIYSFVQDNNSSNTGKGKVWKWDAATGKVVNQAETKGKYYIKAIALSATEDKLVYGCLDEVSVCKKSNMKSIKTKINGKTGADNLDISADGNWLIIERTGYLSLYDMKTYKKVVEVSLPVNYCWDVEIDPTGKFVAAAGGFENNTVFILSFSDLKVVKELKGHSYWVKSLTWGSDGKTLISGGEDSKVILWDLEKDKPKVILLNHENTEDYVFYNSDGYYKITREGFKNVVFKIGLDIFPFEQFDIKFNRPDIILQDLGSTNAELIDLMKKAYEKRLKSVGLKSDNIFKSFYIPQMEVKKIPYSVSTSTVVATLNLSDSLYKLKTINVWVNEVPVYGKSGLDIVKQKSNKYERKIIIPLSEGKNVIEMSCTNVQGAESMRQTFEVNCSFKFPKPNLYVVAMSVSDYKDNNFDLKYARKDGRDMATTLSKGYIDSYVESKGEKYFDKIYIDTLFDTTATKTNFLKLQKKLSQTTANDQVIIFFSGHGLLDKKYDFYYATYDCNFTNPEQKGLSYTDIENMMDIIPSRNKLLLIDACHSGDVDKENIEVTDGASVSGARSDVKVYRTKGSALLKESGSVSFMNSFTLMKELFAGSERGTGAIIISAAAGDSYALESDEWNNGIFTYAILKGLKNGDADANSNKEITVGELKNYLVKEVEIQTQGRQKPTCRRENLEYDFRVK